MARQINAAALVLLCEFEGFRDRPYHDIAGKLTIGYGHLIRPGERFDTITEEQGRTLLMRDVLSTSVCVEKWVRVPLSDNQFGALVCFAYNVGVGNFYRSSVLRDLNEGRYTRVPGDFLMWDRAEGREVSGLRRRREAEGALWSKPDVDQ